MVGLLNNTAGTLMQMFGHEGLPNDSGRTIRILRFTLDLALCESVRSYGRQIGDPWLQLKYSDRPIRSIRS
jgi:hypothetical protein